MKRILISLRSSGAVTILVITVVFLMPVIGLAEDADILKPDVQKPGTLKEVLKKMEIAPNKPGAQLNYLFKLEVPIELKKVHPSVNKAAIICLVSNSEPSGPYKSWGAAWAEIPLQGGDYDGIVNVYITGLAHPEHKPELIDQWECELVFFIDGIDIPVAPDSQSGLDPIGSAHKFGTLFQTNIKGRFD